MKQQKIVQAYKVLETVSKDKEIPSDISYIFYKVRKLLQPQWDFQKEEEQKIFEKYTPKFENEKLVFLDSEKAKQFTEEITKLAEMDIDLGKFEKIDFHPDPRVKLSAEDMDCLEEFLNYI